MRHVQSTLLAIAIACLAGAAHANGTTLMPGGTASVGRGGAIAARPEDPTAMGTNPAGLAFLPGQRFMVDVNAVVQKMCVDPYGYYGWGVYDKGTSEFGDQLKVDNPRRPTIGATYATTPLGTVCNSAPTTPFPQFAWAGRITKNFALGAGIIAPVLVPGMQFGGGDGTIETPYGPRPTPTRYSLIKQEVTYAAAPTLAAAYRFLPVLSAGLSVQILSVAVRATQAQAAFAGTDPATDFLATVSAQDFFVPVLTFSLHARPVRQLNLMTAFKWSDDFRGSGDVTYETNTYYRGANLENAPYKNDPIRIRDITVRFPWELTAGARYAQMLPGAEEGDPMATERWDVEADFAYSFNQRASLASATLGQDATLVTRLGDGTKGMSQTVSADSVPQANVDSHTKDSYAVRIGGSLSVLPKRLAINAGGFYESRAVDLAYADITSFAFQRVGLGLGLLLRFGAWDLRAAAAHVFSETVDIAPPPYQPVEKASSNDPRSGFDERVGGTFSDTGKRQGGVVLRDPSAPADPSKADAVAAKTQSAAAVLGGGVPNRVINAGKYSAAFDVISVGVTYHF
jgi:hypothetical protein